MSEITSLAVWADWHEYAGTPPFDGTHRWTVVRKASVRQTVRGIERCERYRAHCTCGLRSTWRTSWPALNKWMGQHAAEGQEELPL